MGIVTTGNEVFFGHITDQFTPIIAEKVGEYGAKLIGQEVSDDDHEHITACTIKLLDMGAELFCCTGGMSVDPDDRTPLTIRNAGVRVVSYGSPVLCSC